MPRIAIIGAGAAGCFCAAELRRLLPRVRVDVYEAGPKPLAKVAITGGGRCNLTNSFAEIDSLSEAYPRGARLMKRLLNAFSQEDTCRWFEDAGVPLVLQEDQCVFPRSQDAMDIVRALLRRMDGVDLRLRTRVHCLQTPDQVGGDGRQQVGGDGRQQVGGDGRQQVGGDGEVKPGAASGMSGTASGMSGTASVMPGVTGHLFVDGEPYDAVVVTTGGAPKGLPLLDGLDLEWVPTVPSLFTFTVRDEGLRALMGLVVDAEAAIPGTSFKARGPLLITDWGLSGPAILKLSSFAARELAERDYRAPLAITWIPGGEAPVRAALQAKAAGNAQRQVSNTPPEGLPARLWNYLIAKAGIRPDIRWAELGSKGFNRLVHVLVQDSYEIAGKTRFREEFVTCGGVALSNLNPATLESKRYPGLYFAGEVLDIDAITGGFNLQAAWTTGYTVAEAIGHKLRG